MGHSHHQEMRPAKCWQLQGLMYFKYLSVSFVCWKLPNIVDPLVEHCVYSYHWRVGSVFHLKEYLVLYYILEFL